MDRSNPRGSPLFSSLGVAIGILFLIGFGVAIWFTGGSLFSPGPVSAKSKPGLTYGNFSSHADFGNKCSYCHQPLRADQAKLCLQCHTEIEAQIDQHQGTHGKLDNVMQCASCHKEHLGESYDPVQAALKSFDHNQTNFPLAGKHGQIACDDCHEGGNYNAISSACISCHAEPEQHAGLFDTDCASCHTSTSWKPASFASQTFDHANTSFSLTLHAKDRQGQAIACTGCHIGQVQASTSQPFNTSACISCHAHDDLAFMQNHQAQYGANCIVCHDGKDRMHAFNHAGFFPLDGQHAQIKCESCHADQKFRSISTECVSCHQEPAIHAGFFGLKCQLCHTAQAWQPARLIAHSFPLDHGGNAASACQTCHAGPYTEYTCFSCHDHDPAEIAQSHSRAGITSEDLPDCASCHLDGKVHQVKAP